jgi:phosphatidylglycerol:prolipoprotein diacylglycerol transferase
MYGVLYSVMRIIAEFFREPDLQLGFIYSNWLTMGMLISFASFIVSLGALYYIKRVKKA